MLDGATAIAHLAQMQTSVEAWPAPDWRTVVRARGKPGHASVRVYTWRSCMVSFQDAYAACRDLGGHF